MIDGMYPSQLMEVEAMRTSHYRNLKNIVNKHGQHISYPSIDFMQMSRRKKQNHNNWKTYNNLQNQQTRFKKNFSLYEKLQKISANQSRYAVRTDTPELRDPLLHHNYLYECQRRYDSIDKSNELIASRILKVKGDIDRKKQEVEFRINKFNVSRLEKFDRFKRLNRLVSKSMSQKFNGSSSKLSNISNIRAVTVNPESP